MAQGALLADGDHALEDDAHDQHLERHQRQAVQQIEEEVAAVTEDGVVDGEQYHRGRDQPGGEQHEPAALATLHRAISTETLA